MVRKQGERVSFRFPDLPGVIRSFVARSLVYLQLRSGLGELGKYFGGMGKRPKCEPTTLFRVPDRISYVIIAHNRKEAIRP